MTFRAFIAVDLPPAERLDAFARELRTSGASLKIVPVDRLHITLKFLGETEEGLVPDIMAALRGTCANLEPFSLRLRGTGAFPNLSRMNVLWIGVEGGEPLARVAADLDASLAPLGYRRESRPWSPHVTVARVREGRNLDRVRLILRAHAEDTFTDCRVDAFRLKRSVLTRAGAVYSDVETLPLPP